jgi:hypothetical protein
MWQWLAQNSGGLAAVAALLQVVVAVFIYCITARYVAVTKSLADLQAELARIEKENARRELFDRRVKVYDCVMSHLVNFAAKSKFEHAEVHQFWLDTRNAEFLFEADVTDFLSDVGGAAAEFRALQAGPSGFAMHRQRALEQMFKTEFFDRARTVFGRYLHLGDPPKQKD